MWVIPEVLETNRLVCKLLRPKPDQFILSKGGMGKADFIEWIKADFREWSKADSTYAASQQTLFIVSGSPSNPILGEVI